MLNSTTNVNVVWAPIPNTSQEMALDSRCHHTLYTGARGPGKTDTQLMRFRSRVGTGYGPFWRGVIFDREYKNLDDIISKSKRWFSAFKDGAKFNASQGQLKWVWPTGEELLFRVAKKDSDYWNYHGQEFPFIGWNELTKYPTPELYDQMLSTNRSSFTPEKDSPHFDQKIFEDSGMVVFTDNDDDPLYMMPPIPLEVFSTCNPYGAGHNWVKRRFIDPAPYGRVVRHRMEVTDPKTKGKVTVEKTQVAIFGSYVENIYLSPEYVATLESEKDINRRKAWLLGDWDIVAGGALDDVWSQDCILPRFKIPKGWRVDRSFDWGSSHPFAVCWWAEANGEEVEIVYPSGMIRKFAPKAGSLILLFEYYGTKELGTNKGLKMSARKVGENIRDIERALMMHGWIPSQPLAGPADNQIRNVNEKETDTIAKKMEDAGIKWTPSDKASGSRKMGLELMRTMLDNVKDGNNEEVGLYFMDCCRATLATLPTLPRDEKNLDDVDTTAEDHLYDAIRYRVLDRRVRYASSIELNRPT